MPQSAPLQWTYVYLMTHVLFIAIVVFYSYALFEREFVFSFKGYPEFSGGIWGWR